MPRVRTGVALGWAGRPLSSRTGRSLPHLRPRARHLVGGPIMCRGGPPPFNCQIPSNHPPRRFPWLDVLGPRTPADGSVTGLCPRGPCCRVIARGPGRESQSAGLPQRAPVRVQRAGTSRHPGGITGLGAMGYGLHDPVWNSNTAPGYRSEGYKQLHSVPDLLVSVSPLGRLRRSITDARPGVYTARRAQRIVGQGLRLLPWAAKGARHSGTWTDPSAGWYPGAQPDERRRSQESTRLSLPSSASGAKDSRHRSLSSHAQEDEGGCTAGCTWTAWSCGRRGVAFSRRCPLTARCDMQRRPGSGTAGCCRTPRPAKVGHARPPYTGRRHPNKHPRLGPQQAEQAPRSPGCGITTPTLCRLKGRSA